MKRGFIAESVVRVLPTILLIQPPFVQLNTPYPAPYYLKTFLEKRGYRVSVQDHSIGLFERIFCRDGLAKVFAAVKSGASPLPTISPAPRSSVSAPVPSYAAPPPHPVPAMSPSRRFDKTVRPIVDRFLSEERKWVCSIDRLVAFLQGKDREFAHLLTLANGVLPAGPRFDACMERFADQPKPDDAPVLASSLLSDIADFITVTLDPNFSLIRYTSSFSGLGFSGFTQVEQALNGYIINEFYKPYLEEIWQKPPFAAEIALPASNAALDAPETAAPVSNVVGTPAIIGITIPFSGCLLGALVAAASAKARFGGKALTIAGGGYVNTELRSLKAERFFAYFDYLSFDKGYGSLAAILDQEASKWERGKKMQSIFPPVNETQPPVPLYKTMYCTEDGIISDIGRIFDATAVVPGTFSDNAAGFAPPDKPPVDTADPYKRLEDKAVRTVFPDYTGVDFSRYLRPVDDTNPMHRLWSDGHWLKAYVAYGCYWHNCAFCDVQLDYIKHFVPVDVDALFIHLANQAQKTGVRGIHLVDEAAPAAALLRLAELNRSAGLPLLFWGNIRFDRSFSPDVAAILAEGGLVGVSGGIEVASEAGFKRIGKGIGLVDVVRACAAFKEQGILTHAYLIYGYWDETGEEIAASVETMRQLFEAGLLDSAFWHKFVLTRHSRVYAEHRGGLHQDLRVQEQPAGNSMNCDFAANDLSFRGEERFDKYTAPLDQLLAAWMVGNTDRALLSSIMAQTAAPSNTRRAAPLQTVSGLLAEYAADRDKIRTALPVRGKAVFLGSQPVIQADRKTAALFWRYRLSDCLLKTGPASIAAPPNIPPRSGQAVSNAPSLQDLLEQAAAPFGTDAVAFYSGLQQLFGNEAQKIWETLRNSGLAVANL
jgi:radical SAM superfamily enzyme YgiQ (UPF0313 family)